MAKYILAAFLLSTAIAICIKAEERIETITFLTSYCDDCGMDFTGSVAVKVCGDYACCFTPWMQADFREGEVAHLSGGTIHECFKYKISEGNFDANTTTIEITVFHQGTDGVSFDAIGIETEEYDVYNCVFTQPKFLDGDMWETTTECSGN